MATGTDKDGNIPSSDAVEKFHRKADTDGSETSAHHTLGNGRNQAAPGNHDHRGGSSILLLEGFTLTGSRGGNAAVSSIIAALVELGATDSTTA